MSKNTYIEKFFKIDIQQDAILIYVKDIKWLSPYQPQEHLELVATLIKNTGEAGINQAIEATLNNQKHFITCSECNELNLTNHMHNNELCLACAANNHGIIY